VMTRVSTAAAEPAAARHTSTPTANAAAVAGETAYRLLAIRMLEPAFQAMKPNCLSAARADFSYVRVLASLVSRRRLLNWKNVRVSYTAVLRWSCGRATTTDHLK